MDYMLDKLQKSFEKEKQFTADVSHELRTPLAVIITESEYALMHAQNLKEAQESMKVVKRQAGRMSALINQLLFFSRSDSGSFILNKESFEVFPVILELVEELSSLAEAASITINLRSKPKGKLSITADQLLFTRSLSNILQNALTYSNSGGYINILVLKKDCYLTISVSDDGIGIASENLEKIWDRFYQVEQSRSKAKGSSMGLGLAMVKTIVEKHGGYATVESTLFKGSTFTLYYPISD